MNNFDFIRLLASVFVLIGHGYFISNSGEIELFGKFLGVAAIHDTAVCIFFIISGYLVSKSYLRSASSWIYLRNRLLRIFPGLIFSLIITFLGIGLFFQNQTMVDYVRENFHFLYHSFLFYENFKMTGVFENNPDTNFVNRSLWTLKYEFLMYVLVLILGRLKLLKSFFVWGLLLASLITYFFIDAPYFKFQSMFLLGTSYLFVEKRWGVPLKRGLVIIVPSFIFVRLLPTSSFRMELLELIVPFLFFYFGLFSTRGINNFTKRVGDLSYGVYLYAYPVQQIVFLCFNGSFWVQNIQIFNLLSLLICLFFAFISWHLIEKNFLRLKMKK